MPTGRAVAIWPVANSALGHFHWSWVTWFNWVGPLNIQIRFPNFPGDFPITPNDQNSTEKSSGQFLGLIVMSH
jgi:hypothetical protein